MLEKIQIPLEKIEAFKWRRIDPLDRALET
jgi:hypothetical protein